MTDDDPFSDASDPTDLTDLSRADQRLSVEVERRTDGDPVTVVEECDPGGVDVDELAADLESALDAGGTVADGAIELRGDHAERVRDLLVDRGFTVA